MIYNLSIALFVLAMAPKIVWQSWRRGKKVPSFAERLGFQPPVGKESRSIWIHAVSVGEAKSAQPLVQLLRKSHPEAEILITTGTLAGLEEARRSLSSANQFRILPLDFSWIMRRWVRSFHPDQMIFIEGDIWPNLLAEVQKTGARTALVSGKISEKSAKRFSRFRSIARRLFGSLDLLSVQNEEYLARFASLVDRPIHVTGNLKLDVEPQPVDPEAARRRFSIDPSQPVLTLACTHAPEEKELLSILRPLWDEIPHLVLFIAPRHPERFNEVASILQDLQISFCHWNDQRAQERIVLVDTMGQLSLCYAISNLAISAGSFSSRVGGHNVFEPCLHGCPVLFGPHTKSQREFVRIVLEAGVGCQLEQSDLLFKVREWLGKGAVLREKTLRLAAKNRGSAARTFALLSL